jgi:hypothetical protein
MTRTRAAVVLSAFLLCAASAQAHHSFAAQYDANKPITLRGTISRMLWSNPHGHLYIDVKVPDGTVVTWELETASPAGLYRRGWRRDDLPIGSEVVVRAFLARDGTPTANATTVTLTATGRELFAGAAGTGAPVEPPGEGAAPR